MIISASRRTDIPSFYSDWFFNRLEAGFVCTRNPMKAHQVSRIFLSPEVDAGAVKQQNRKCFFTLHML